MILELYQLSGSVYCTLTVHKMAVQISDMVAWFMWLMWVRIYGYIVSVKNIQNFFC